MNILTKREYLQERNLWDLPPQCYISRIKTGDHITQKDIAQAAGITEVTLRNRLKDMRNKLQLT